MINIRQQKEQAYYEGKRWKFLKKKQKEIPEVKNC